MNKLQITCTVDDQKIESLDEILQVRMSPRGYRR